MDLDTKDKILVGVAASGFYETVPFHCLTNSLRAPKE